MNARRVHGNQRGLRQLFMVSVCTRASSKTMLTKGSDNVLITVSYTIKKGNLLSCE